MCGRYRLTAKERYIAEHFGVDEAEVHWSARYNLAPTQEVAVIRQDRKEPKRHFSLMRWGLIPYWSKDASIAARTINAMAETVAEKPTFRDAVRKNRCLIPADGFYEWKKLGAKEKQPYNIGMRDDGLFAFAGLWDRWKTPGGDIWETCSVITTDANSLLQPIHTRMPVILKPEDYDSWLDPGIQDPVRVEDLLKPFDAQRMKIYPLSSRVSNVNNDDPECIREVPPAAEAAPMLF
ncbi:MAG TPA: SOS response-associated peptidase [Candidatus Angelobacter sp.]|jgi:putative SOS response-associated peptidase YedK|nr:SOS response-associated peptidase [Candidatus Angelobacter sp.]